MPQAWAPFPFQDKKPTTGFAGKNLIHVPGISQCHESACGPAGKLNFPDLGDESIDLDIEISSLAHIEITILSRPRPVPYLDRMTSRSVICGHPSLTFGQADCFTHFNDA